MAKAKYSEKVGATGKKYKVYSDRIEVTYKDGSSRIVRPTDASYQSTKAAMDKDVASKKWWKSGNSKTNASNALGKGKTDGLVSTAGNSAVDAAIQKEKAIQQRTQSMADLESKVNKTKTTGAALDAAQPLHERTMQNKKQLMQDERVLGYGVESGVNQLVGGVKSAALPIVQDLNTTFRGEDASLADIKNPFNTNENLAQAATRLAIEQTLRQQNLQKKWNYDQFSDTEKTLSNVGSAVTTMAPVFLPGIGLPIFAANAVGNSFNQALNEGASYKDAANYAILSGAAEGATGMVGKGFNVLPGVLNTEQLLRRVLTNPTVRKGASFVGDSGLEAAEEVAMTAIDPYLQRHTYNPDAENATLADAREAATIGFITSLLLKGSADVLSSDAKSQLQQKNVQNLLENVIRQGQTVQNPQNNVQNQGVSAQTAQNQPKPVQETLITNPMGSVTNIAKNPTSKADFGQNIEKNIQSQNLDDLREKYGGSKNISDAVLKSSIETLLRNGNMNSELLGKTLWIYGDGTKAVKDDLKNMGFRWHTKRKAWYKGNVAGQNENLDAVSQDVINKTLGVQTKEFDLQNKKTSIADVIDNYQNYDVSKLPEEVFDFYNRVVAKSGLDVYIMDGLPNGANGMIKNNTIYLDGNKVNIPETMRKVTAHEVYHALKGTNEFLDLQDVALDYLLSVNEGKTREQLLQEKIDQYAQYGESIDTDTAYDELTASFMEVALSDQKVAEKVWRENPTLGQRIMDAINKLLAWFNNRQLTVQEQKQQALLNRAADMYSQGLQSMKYQSMQQNNTTKYSISKTTSGEDVVVIDSNIFDSKPEGMKDHEYIEEYIKSHVGDVYRIAESGQKVYIGEDLPGEFTHSKSTQRLLARNQRSLNAKNQSMQNVGELIEIATNRRWSKNEKEKHEIDAKYGWYNYTTRFALPNGKVYTAELLIRNDADGKKYLYDEISIKKDTSSSLASTQNGSAMGGRMNLPKERNVFGEDSISQNQQNINNDTHYSFDDMVDQYGAMPPGENPFGDNRDIKVPQQTSDFDKVRRFNRTGMEAEQVSDETVDIMKDRLTSDYQDGSMTYEPISNKDTLADANVRIKQNGWESEAKIFSVAVSKGTRITAEDIAVAERCIQEAQNAGNYEAAADIISDLSIVGTEYGQAIQALSMLKRLSPEGQLKTLQKVQKRINNQLMAQNKDPVDTISQEKAAEFLAARGNKKRDEIYNSEIARMAQETQGNWKDKLNALRYAAMLRCCLIQKLMYET